jgi:hypothetical protein
MRKEFDEFPTMVPSGSGQDEECALRQRELIGVAAQEY